MKRETYPADGQRTQPSLPVFTREQREWIIKTCGQTRIGNLLADMGYRGCNLGEALSAGYGPELEQRLGVSFAEIVKSTPAAMPYVPPKEIK